MQSRAILASNRFHHLYEKELHFPHGSLLAIFRNSPPLLYVFIAFWCHFALFVVLRVVSWRGSIGDNPPGFRELVTACERFRPFGDSFIYVNFPAETTGVLVFATLMILLIAIERAPSAYSTLRSIARITSPVVFLVCSAFVLFSLSRVAASRRDLRGAVGADFDDDEWGFGQVLAVFIWLPITFKVIRLLWREYARVIWSS